MVSNLNFCIDCGAALQQHIIAGETRNHGYCPVCAVPRYGHPMIVVTVFVAYEKRLLWVQRNLEPKRGLWAIPGGFLESGETLAEGAARELWEESGVQIPPQQLQLYMTGTITFINQIYVAFRATVDSDYCEGGEESQDCRYYSEAECPWEQLAYPEVNDSIIQAYADLESGKFDVWQAQMTDSLYEFLPISQQGS